MPSCNRCSCTLSCSGFHGSGVLWPAGSRRSGTLPAARRTPTTCCGLRVAVAQVHCTATIRSSGTSCGLRVAVAQVHYG